MAVLKRRESGQSYNQTTIRMSTDVYNGILQYARYAEDEPMTLALAIETIIRNGLKSAKITERVCHIHSLTSKET